MNLIYTKDTGRKDACLMACISSLIGIPHEEIPDLYGDDGSWLKKMMEWVAGRGWGMMYIMAPYAGACIFTNATLIGVFMTDSNEHHAVLVKQIHGEEIHNNDGTNKIDCWFEVIHNPTPEVEVQDLISIIMLHQ